MNQLLNVVYGFLSEGLEPDALDEFDRNLALEPGAPPAPAKSRGTQGLMAMMGGGAGRRPAGPGG